MFLSFLYGRVALCGGEDKMKTSSAWRRQGTVEEYSRFAEVGEGGSEGWSGGSEGTATTSKRSWRTLS